MSLLPAHSITQTHRLLHGWTQKDGSNPNDSITDDLLTQLAEDGRRFAETYPSNDTSRSISGGRVLDVTHGLMRRYPYAMDHGLAISAFCLGVMNKLTLGRGQLPSGYAHWCSVIFQHELAATWLMASKRTRERIAGFAKRVGCTRIDWQSTRSGVFALTASVQAAHNAKLNVCLPTALEDLRDKIDLLVFDDSESPIGLAVQIKRWARNTVELRVIKQRDDPDLEGNSVELFWNGMGFFNPKHRVNFAPVVMNVGHPPDGQLFMSDTVRDWSDLFVGALVEARDI